MSVCIALEGKANLFERPRAGVLSAIGPDARLCGSPVGAPAGALLRRTSRLVFPVALWCRLLVAVVPAGATRGAGGALRSWRWTAFTQVIDTSNQYRNRTPTPITELNDRFDYVRSLRIVYELPRLLFQSLSTAPLPATFGLRSREPLPLRGPPHCRPVVSRPASHKPASREREPSSRRGIIRKS